MALDLLLAPTRVRLLSTRALSRLGFREDSFLIVLAVLIGVVTAAAYDFSDRQISLEVRSGDRVQMSEKTEYDDVKRETVRTDGRGTRIGPAAQVSSPPRKGGAE